MNKEKQPNNTKKQRIPNYNEQINEHRTHTHTHTHTNENK